MVSTLRDADDVSLPLEPAPLPSSIPPTNPLMTHTSEDLARLNEVHTNFDAEQNDEDMSDGGMYSYLNVYGANLIVKSFISYLPCCGLQ